MPAHLLRQLPAFLIAHIARGANLPVWRRCAFPYIPTYPPGSWTARFQTPLPPAPWTALSFPRRWAPKNRKEPIGRLGPFSPARPRFTALATAATASSWPTTRPCRVFSSFSSRFPSSWATCLAGIPVQSDTVAAISLRRHCRAAVPGSPAGLLLLSGAGGTLLFQSGLPFSCRLKISLPQGFFQRLFLLPDLFFQLLYSGRQAVQSQLPSGRRFVHQVNGLIRKEPVVDIPVRQLHRSVQRFVRNGDAVVFFIDGPQPPLRSPASPPGWVPPPSPAGNAAPAPRLSRYISGTLPPWWRRSPESPLWREKAS